MVHLEAGKSSVSAGSDGEESCELIAHAGCSPGSHNITYWDGRISPIDIKNGSQAFLEAYDCTNDSYPVFYSHYFNLTEADAAVSSSSHSDSASPTILMTPTSTDTAAANPLSSASSAPTTTAAVTTTTNTGASTGSSAAAVGAGVGGGVAGALLIVGGGVALWRLRRNRLRRRSGRKSSGGSSTMVCQRPVYDELADRNSSAVSAVSGEGGRGGGPLPVFEVSSDPRPPRELA